MNKFYTLIIFLFFLLSSFSQVNEIPAFGTDNTFEIMSWNIEWFPKNDELTVEYVTDIIEYLDVDIIAIQEVDSILAFEDLVDGLTDYTGYLESSYFAGLAYIYNPSVVEINDIYEIYTTYPYWSPFPRSPMVMDLNYMGERIIVINNHLKCCGDEYLDMSDEDDEEYRRYYANNLLKQYIDNNFQNENVIVLGDYNDVLTDNESNNVFQQFLDDTDNYLFADYDIAQGNSSEWSYPSWPSHLDHILITNELFDDFANEGSFIEAIKLEDYITGGWSSYDYNVSDHRPVALKLEMNPYSDILTDILITDKLNVYPNPANTEANINFESSSFERTIEVSNIQGQIVLSESISPGESTYRLKTHDWQSGTYFVRLIECETSIAVERLVVLF